MNSLKHGVLSRIQPGERFAALKKKWQTLPVRRKVHGAIGTEAFGRIYAWSAVIVLLGTTIFWSTLGARVNRQNADQLVNALLFENPDTFHNALIPGSHSFFMKWPVFYLIRLLGFSSTAYTSMTILLAVLTVGGLAYIMYRIDRRPLVFGTAILGLSSVLLLIPVVPYPGALLPVSMAMVTTRNIEYVIYIAALVMLTQTQRIRSWQFGLAALLLTVLMASDKLFLTLSLGGAAIAITLNVLLRSRQSAWSAARWLLATVISAVLSMLILLGLTAGHMVRMAQQEGLGPYGVVRSVHKLLVGMSYAILHILTNMGANPAAQTTIIRNIPHDAVRSLEGASGLTYLLNVGILLFGIYAAGKLVRHWAVRHKAAGSFPDRPAQLALMLVWTTVAAFVVFILSNHDYAVDARYISIITFTVAISSLAYASRRNFPAARLTGFGLLFTLGIALAIPAVLDNYTKDQQALAPYSRRNQLILAALKRHPVDVVVGDYWRVIPLKAESARQAVLPLAACTRPRDSLTSVAWEPDLAHTRFAYLLSLDTSLTDFSRCTEAQVYGAYGHPAARVVIAGSDSNPVEELLLYGTDK